MEATDPRGLRRDAPLLDAWLRSQEPDAGVFSPSPATSTRTEPRSGDVVAGDRPPLRRSRLDVPRRRRPRRRRGAGLAEPVGRDDMCCFSVGGSTHGNQALALAIARPGDRVIVGRTLHRSMLLALVLAGLVPV